MTITLTHEGNEYIIQNDDVTILSCSHDTLIKISSGQTGVKQRILATYCEEHDLDLATVTHTIKRLFDAMDTEEGNTLVRTAQWLGNEKHLEYVEDMKYWLQYRDGFWQEVGEYDVKAFVTNCLIEHNMRINLLPQLLEQLTIQHHLRYHQLNPRGYLNINNGILNTSTLSLLKHSPEMFFTYKINVNYLTEDAPTPTWDKYVSESIAPHDKENFLKWMTGMFRGIRKNEMMLWLYGESNSGKSVCLDLIKIFFKHAMSNVAVSSMGGAFGLEPITKAYVNIDPDMNDGSFGNSTVSKFKQLTDENADVSINGKNIKEETVKWYGYLIGASNKLPSMPAGTDIKAVMKRSNFVHFPKTFPKNDAFKAALEAEADAIFSKLIKREFQIIVTDMESWIESNLTRYNNYKNNTRRFIRSAYRFSAQPVSKSTPEGAVYQEDNKKRFSWIFAHVSKNYESEGIGVPKQLDREIKEELELMGIDVVMKSGYKMCENMVSI